MTSALLMLRTETKFLRDVITTRYYKGKLELMFAVIFELSRQRWSLILPIPPSSYHFDAVIPEPMNAFFDVLVNNENAKDWRKFDQ
jgi:hypothetical protein